MGDGLVPLPCINIPVILHTYWAIKIKDSFLFFVCLCVCFVFINSMPSVSLKVNPNFQKWSLYVQVLSHLCPPLSAATSAAGDASILAFSPVVSQVVLLSCACGIFYGCVIKWSIFFHKNVHILGIMTEGVAHPGVGCRIFSIQMASLSHNYIYIYSN